MDKIKEQLISFETAKLAKELGFDWYTDRMYSVFYVSEDIDVTYNYKSKKKLFKEGTLIDEENYLDETSCTTHNIPEQYWIPAPTQSLLQKWLYEIHNCFIIISLGYKIEYTVIQSKENLPIWDTNNWIYRYKDSLYDTFEEAFEEGLKYTLNYLIDQKNK